mmetsp:Transcript_14750/g.14165  ORF Transcript_14750/g.14165 Transcript_14750/m.14165 type:complete len:208 (-) Transcript_14750:1015-1638(-)
MSSCWHGLTISHNVLLWGICYPPYHAISVNSLTPLTSLHVDRLTLTILSLRSPVSSLGTHSLGLGWIIRVISLSIFSRLSPLLTRHTIHHLAILLLILPVLIGYSIINWLTILIKINRLLHIIGRLLTISPSSSGVTSVCSLWHGHILLHHLLLLGLSHLSHLSHLLLLMLLPSIVSLLRRLALLVLLILIHHMTHSTFIAYLMKIR